MSNNSIELFAIALYEGGYLQGNGDEINDLLKGYKAMHLEEVQNAWYNGYFHCSNERPMPDNECVAKQYYYKTFGGNK
jgi:hypothetical protein